VYDSGDATGDLLLQLTGREIVDAPPVHSSAGVLFVELAASTLDDTPLFAMNTYASGVSFEWATFDEGVCPRGCSTPNGTCVDGVCICEAGFAGGDCSSSRCSGTTRREVDATGVAFSSSSAPGQYHGNAECRWIFTSTSGSQLELLFVRFSVERNYDWLRAFAGDGVEGVVVYEFTGDELPTTVRLPSQSTLRFSSDWGGTDMNGFEAIVRDASDGCGDPPCSARGTCVEGACVCDAGYFGDFCAMTHCVPQSGVLAGPSGWLRTQAPGETSKIIVTASGVSGRASAPTGSP